MSRVVLFVLLVAGFACGNHSDSTTAASSVRYTNAEQHYTVDQPEGWTVALDRGSARFAPAGKASGKHTIVIRSAARPSEIKEGQPATNADVITATTQVLGALPRARIETQRSIDVGALSGERFSVTFLPNGVTSRYRRTQVTLLGKTRVFHVIYTAPESEAVDESVLQLMVSTLEEKV